MSQQREIMPGDPGSSVIVHVPHASTAIPDDARISIVLDDDALAAELAAMTDAHTDVIASRAAFESRRQPWLFLNRLSRLVIDPERFPDEREEMRAVGMGAVYTRTSRGDVLRTEDAEMESRLVKSYLDPYATAMTDLVDRRLSAHGRVVIIDVHSYPASPLPYELHADRRRPAVCVGTDPVHTPAALIDAVTSACAPADVITDEPFAGAYVPLRWYGRDPRVSAIMLEFRRDTYLDESTGDTHAGLVDVISTLGRVIDAAETVSG